MCLAWFGALAAAGLWNVARNPQVLAALNPLHALQFVTAYGFASFVVLGSVLLAITGAEALYADMGHFGKRAVRIAWFGLVAPALVLNYFGQGALLLDNPRAIANPFYLAFPPWALYPMVMLATAATVIASQAVISGAYSVTQQAIQLGYLPRLRILHTSAQASGQIYVPAVNWLLFAAVLAVVIGFGSSAELAQAYGVAVMGTMLATTFLTFFVVRFAWGLPLALCLAGALGRLRLPTVAQAGQTYRYPFVFAPTNDFGVRVLWGPSVPDDDGTPGAEVRRALRRALGREDGPYGLVACYAMALRQNRALRGAIIGEVTVLPNGAVTRARVVEDELGDGTTQLCVLQMLRAVDRVNPAPVGQSAAIRIRYEFSVPSPSRR